ncbi:Histidine kinase [Mariniphaga anaerophila]|uniref:Histidine kinase n=1 Tax=Mariniphaga anaerophila TaxID=1484053 RepID=A0A1M4YBG6_9BACT|nr:histidine kinase [Mariniphaga anaerophila]SHF03154.1 Histidine kinase [Mariniphaga anaerophila]
MDFKHPFISNFRLAIYYVLIWLLFIAGSVLLKWLAYGFDPGMAVIEAFALPFTFGIIGASIWYVIRYSTLENYSPGRIIISHLIAATIIVFIWMYLGVVIIKLLHPYPEQWIDNNLASNIFTGYILYLTFVIFFYAVNYYQGFKEKLRNEGKLKSLVKEAELHALKSQINPHFLFNSLNSISSLTMTDPAKAQEMVINLSSLMRYSLKHDQIDKVPFSEELNNNKLYLHIEKVRFGTKLNPVFNIEKECMEALIPNMILQPLYENAIKYGVYEATEPVDIITTATLKDNALEIVITNNYDPNSISKKGEGIGLRNIRDRLQIIYNNPMLMKVEDNKKEFKVTLAIPQK